MNESARPLLICGPNSTIPILILTIINSKTLCNLVGGDGNDNALVTIESEVSLQFTSINSVSIHNRIIHSRSIECGLLCALLLISPRSSFAIRRFIIVSYSESRSMSHGVSHSVRFCSSFAIRRFAIHHRAPFSSY